MHLPVLRVKVQKLKAPALSGVFRISEGGGAVPPPQKIFEIFA